MIKATYFRKDILDRKQDINDWVKENRSKAWICRELKCHPDTLNRYLNKFNIEYKGNKGCKKYKKCNKYNPALYYIENNLFIGSHELKKKLIRDGIKKAECERCKQATWQGQSIPLELHHKDGNHYNNELSNLEILCPNCHALEENNSGSANKRRK